MRALWQSGLRACWERNSVGILCPMFTLDSHGVATFPSSQVCRRAGMTKPLAGPRRLYFYPKEFGGAVFLGIHY